MKNIKHIMALLLVLALALGLVACGGTTAADTTAAPASTAAAAETTTAAVKSDNLLDPANYKSNKPENEWKIAVVTKDNTAAWFVRMEEGVMKFKEESGLDVFQKGPATGDAASQVQVVEDILAQGVDAICVVPIDPAALEPTFQAALEQGVVVVTHEASTQENTLFNIEAFTAKQFGEALMDALAKEMGNKGLYTTMVGYATSASHMDWMNAAVAHQKATYPEMTLLNDQNPGAESEESRDISYERAKELLKANTDLAGILGAASTDAPGCARAIEELGIVDKVAIVGTGTPNENKVAIESGSMRAIKLWDPAAAGYAMVDLAVKILRGEPVGDGVNLGAEGWTDMQLVEGTNNQLTGSGDLTITKENISNYDF